MIQDTRDSEMLRAYLAGRDRECPMCRYNVRDLTTGKCPECGAELLLELRPRHGRFGLWLTSIVGLALTLGVCLFALLVFLILTITHGMNEWSTFWFIPVFAGVCGLGLAALVVYARRFRSAARGPRVAVAIVSVASLGLVTYLILLTVEVF